MQIHGCIRLGIVVKLVRITVVRRLIRTDTSSHDELVVVVEFFLNKDPLILLDQANLLDSDIGCLVQVRLRTIQSSRCRNEGISVEVQLLHPYLCTERDVISSIVGMYQEGFQVGVCIDCVTLNRCTT